MIGFKGLLRFAEQEGIADISNVTKEEAIDWLSKIGPSLIGIGKKLLVVAIFLFVSKRLIQWLKRLLERTFLRSDLDEGVSKFLLSLTNVSLNVLMAIVAINLLGIATGSITALLGSVGVTLGLALQGSLSNLFGGILILIMKPFKIGDYIAAGSDEGTVEEIDIFYTKLLTIDNRKVVIPNGNLSNQSIVNATNEERRRLDIRIPIEYSERVSRVKELLWKIMEKEERILKEPEPVVVVSDFADSAVIMEIRVWTRTEAYWPLKWELLEQIKEAFDNEGIVIPFNQIEVTLKK